MHADGKSTFASVSKWNSGKVNYSSLSIFVTLKVTGLGTLTPVINQLKLNIAWREMYSGSTNPRSTVVLLDTGTPGTSREIFSEDTNDGTRGRNPSITNRVL